MFYASRLSREHPLRLPIRDEAACGEDDGVDAQRGLRLRDGLVGQGRSPGRDAPGEKKNNDVQNPSAERLAGRK